MKYPEKDEVALDLEEAYEEERYLAELKREWYHDFWRLMEECDTDYDYEEEDDTDER